MQHIRGWGRAGWLVLLGGSKSPLAGTPPCHLLSCAMEQVSLSLRGHRLTRGTEPPLATHRATMDSSPILSAASALPTGTAVLALAHGLTDSAHKPFLNMDFIAAEAGGDSRLLEGTGGGRVPSH